MSFLADRSAVSIGLGGIPSLRSGTGGLNPSLDLNFAVSKSLDPRITFTRASEGRYYDASTVALAEQNLLKYSQDFDNAVWGKTSVTITANTTTAPDGTTTAASLVTANDSSGLLYLQQLTAVAAPALFSIYAKANTANHLGVVLGNAGVFAGVDLSTGTVTLQGSGYVVTAASIGGGWYRVTVAVAGGGDRARIFASTTPITVANQSVTGDGTSGIYIWGAQLEQRSTVTAYTPTTTAAVTNYIPVLQTAANGVARFDHNPVTGESLGLLIEEQRTNLLTYSGTMSNASAWALERSTPTSTTIAPDGTNSAACFDAVGPTFALARQGIASISGSYTLSVYAKALPNTANRYLFIGLVNGSAGFDLVGGSVIMTASGAAASISAAGNGWYKCTVAFTASSATQQYFYFSNNPTGALSPAVGPACALWGAQLEAGAFATSYIPTTTAQVTRAADSAVMTGANFSSWYRADEGTLYAEAESSRVTVNLAGIYSLSDNTSANRIESYASAANHLYVVAGGALQADLDGGAFSTNVFTKLAAVYKVNDMAVVLNSGVVAADTSAVVPSVNKLWVGANYDGATALNGHIKKLAYYPVRLANATLQSLTA